MRTSPGLGVLRGKKTQRVGLRLRGFHCQVGLSCFGFAPGAAAFWAVFLCLRESADPKAGFGDFGGGGFGGAPKMGGLVPPFVLNAAQTA